jgi:UTP-glucose-1-phosphate uridylyltransferase
VFPFVNFALVVLNFVIALMHQVKLRAHMGTSGCWYSVAKIMIKKAVFPIAGLGTRFLPVTKASAKEMLPVVDKPLIQYAVEEAYAAGIRQMIFVTGHTKPSVEDHFDAAYVLETELEMADKTALLDVARSIAPEDMLCTYVRQPRAGLGPCGVVRQRVGGR